MIELDGKQYAIKTAQENADDIVQWVNEYCNNNNIKNSRNETIYIDSTLVNPLYLIIRGLGFLITVLQNLLYSLGCSVSIANASEKQLLNLADIAGIKRGQATRTTIDLLIYASATNACSIRTTDTVTVNNIQYAPAFDITVEASGVGHLVLIAQESGSFSISENTLTEFDEPIANLASIKQYASIPGAEEETVESLRERLQRRKTSGTQIDRAADAIRALEGVTLCNIYFNESSTQDRDINGITVGKRSALILVQGYSSEIAKTFFQNCICPTTAATVNRTLTQTYTTHAGQSLPCYIVSPTAIPVFITLYLNQIVPENIQQNMREAIMTIARSLTAGQSLTSAMILASLEDYKSYGILGATAGINSSIQSYKVDIQVDELLTFNSENIVVDMTAGGAV